jgi:hypothetical protein
MSSPLLVLVNCFPLIGPIRNMALGHTSLFQGNTLIHSVASVVFLWIMAPSKVSQSVTNRAPT